MGAIGCAVDSIKLAICLAALGVLALMVGIGWNARPFKKETK